MIKAAVAVVVLLVVGVVTIPWWGSCELKQQYCNTSCSIKHFNNDMKAAGCRTSCSLASARCHGDEAAQKFNDFMGGLKGN